MLILEAKLLVMTELVVPVAVFHTGVAAVVLVGAPSTLSVIGGGELLLAEASNPLLLLLPATVVRTADCATAMLLLGEPGRSF